jgi:hypothetical protein
MNFHKKNTTPNSLFKTVLALLNDEIHPVPNKEEARRVIEILTKGQGYLTKDKPIKIIFYDEI